MERIDHGGRRPAVQSPEHAAGHDVDRMRGGIAPRDGLVGRGPVVEASGHLVDMLVQRAAQRDVELLVTTADREQRQPGLDRAQRQRQRRGVPARIEPRLGARGRAAVAQRLDIGRASGEQQPVDPREQRVGLHRRAERRQDHGHAAARQDRAKIRIGGGMEIVPVGQHAGGDADQGLAGRRWHRVSGTAALSCCARCLPRGRRRAADRGPCRSRSRTASPGSSRPGHRRRSSWRAGTAGRRRRA